MATSILTKDQMATLLGRPLSDYEESSFDTLQALAVSQLERLLGDAKLQVGEATYSYPVRRDYRLLFIDPFTELVSVEIDGVTTTAEPTLYENVNADWFNSLLFTKPLKGERVTVTAKFGYGDELPLDLQRLIATLFGASGQPVDTASNGSISSESILNHSVSYSDASADALERFVAANKATLNYYAKQPNVAVYGDDYALPRLD